MHQNLNTYPGRIKVKFNQVFYYVFCVGGEVGLKQFRIVQYICACNNLFV